MKKETSDLAKFDYLEIFKSHCQHCTAAQNPFSSEKVEGRGGEQQAPFSLLSILNRKVKAEDGKQERGANGSEGIFLGGNI